MSKPLPILGSAKGKEKVVEDDGIGEELIVGNPTSTNLYGLPPITPPRRRNTDEASIKSNHSGDESAGEGLQRVSPTP